MATKRRKKVSRKKKAAKKKSVKNTARKKAAKKARAKRLDALLDRELEDTFPASDPVELTEPGIRARKKR